MALFQRTYYPEEPSFTGLFRMLDAFENYNAQVNNSRQGNRHRAFTPKFDVRETDNTYELHGELPGIERENIQIDFTEPQTLVVSGRVERNYSSGTPPDEESDTHAEHSHKATVSDEAAEAAKENGKSETAMTQSNQQKAVGQKRERFWQQERVIGQFHRTFTFPVPVDENNAKANLENGILHISVPKAAKRESRRIAIN